MSTASHSLMKARSPLCRIVSFWASTCRLCSEWKIWWTVVRPIFSFPRPSPVMKCRSRSSLSYSTFWPRVFDSNGRCRSTAAELVGSPVTGSIARTSASFWRTPAYDHGRRIVRDVVEEGVGVRAAEPDGLSVSNVFGCCRRGSRRPTRGWTCLPLSARQHRSSKPNCRQRDGGWVHGFRDCPAHRSECRQRESWRARRQTVRTADELAVGVGAQQRDAADVAVGELDAEHLGRLLLDVGPCRQPAVLAAEQLARRHAAFRAPSRIRAGRPGARRARCRSGSGRRTTWSRCAASARHPRLPRWSNA